MAFRADIYLNRIHGRTSHERLSACAGYLDFFIIRMYFLFQLSAS
jgi:hypothetical protein